MGSEMCIRDSFCIELYEIQHRAGRLFLHEHPRFAWSWLLPAMQKLRARLGVWEIGMEQCGAGLVVPSDNGDFAPAEKKTGWLTNSEYLAEAVDIHCPNLDPSRPDLWHVHQQLVGGRAKWAEEYPPELVRRILKGFSKHLVAYGVLHSFEVGVHVQEDDVRWTDVENKVYVDNISGALLDGQKVAEARKVEVDYCESFPVWEEKPASELPPDATLVGTVWVDTDKGDYNHPDYRCRLCAQELKMELGRLSLGQRHKSIQC